MALFDSVKGAQNGNESDKTSLIRQFSPLLKKYAHRLCFVEDAYEILLVEFFELLMNIQIDSLRNKIDGALVKFFETSIYRIYTKLLDKFFNEDKHIVLISEQTEAQQANIYNAQVILDDYFKVEYSDVLSLLTPKEAQVLTAYYVDGYSVAYLAGILGVSRQAIDQVRRNAIQK